MWQRALRDRRRGAMARASLRVQDTSASNPVGFRWWLSRKTATAGCRQPTDDEKRSSVVRDLGSGFSSRSMCGTQAGQAAPRNINTLRWSSSKTSSAGDSFSGPSSQGLGGSTWCNATGDSIGRLAGCTAEGSAVTRRLIKSHVSRCSQSRVLKPSYVK